MSLPRVFYAEQHERIGTLPAFGIDVGLACIGQRKALITWGRGVPADEVGTKYDAQEYVILGRGGRRAERIICSQDGFGEPRARDATVNFVLNGETTAANPEQTGWVACDDSQGDRIDKVEHGPIRPSPEEAQRDAQRHGYEDIRYVGPGGYLYLEP